MLSTWWNPCKCRIQGLQATRSVKAFETKFLTRIYSQSSSDSPSLDFLPFELSLEYLKSQHSMRMSCFSEPVSIPSIRLAPMSNFDMCDSAEVLESYLGTNVLSLVLTRPIQLTMSR